MNLVKELPSKVMTGKICIKPIVPTGNKDMVLGLDGRPLKVDTNWDGRHNEIVEGEVMLASQWGTIDPLRYFATYNLSQAQYDEKFKGKNVFWHKVRSGIFESDIIGFHTKQIDKYEYRGEYAIIDYNDVIYSRDPEGGWEKIKYGLVPLRGWVILKPIPLSLDEDGLVRNKQGIVISNEPKFAKNRWVVTWKNPEDLPELQKYDIIVTDTRHNAVTPVMIDEKLHYKVAVNQVFGKSEESIDQIREDAIKELEIGM